MSNHPEPEFIQLRRLLALKRHEQPPPGYFDFLAGQIQASLSASPSRGTTLASAGFLRRLLRRLEAMQTRPAFAVGVGAAFCVLLVGSVVLFENSDPAGEPVAPLLTGTAPQPMTSGDMAVRAGFDSSLLLASNSPATLGSNLFDLIQPPTFDRAGVNP